MVMHARKTQHINDGYFEKHQAHPYQNSKYSNSKGSYSERYNERGIRDSPNGNSYRSESPDGASPGDRTYPSKHYIHKIRDKERDNRDYISSRDKYSDCSRSPKDKRRDDGRANHEERVLRVGEWTEHISSSGKKYYYNCKTEVSQWEKPREWIDRDRRHVKDDPRYLARIAHEKHSTPRGPVSSSSGASRMDRNDATPTVATCLMVPPWNRHDAEDMDISPSSSTPRSDPERRNVVTSSASINPLGAVNATPTVATAHQACVASSPAPAPAALLIPPANAASALPRLSVPPSNSKSDEPPPLTIELPQGGSADTGPPTPTHSETHDVIEPRKVDSPVNNASVSTVSSSLLALRPTTAPHLTPSLGNYFREELTDHIKDWPVHAIEKQVMKVSEELHNMTSIHCARVSSELKTARAVVRLTEIQATLQEQRILFLRQQIKALEELNTHSFMGD